MKFSLIFQELNETEEKMVKDMNCFFLNQENNSNNLYILHSVPSSRTLAKNSKFQDLKDFMNHNFVLYESIHHELNTNNILEGKKFKNIHEIQNFYSAYLKNASVRTNYPNDLQFNYTIDGIQLEMTPNSKMEGEKSFLQYYAEKYSLKIVDENQPLLRAIKGNVFIYLVPELVRRVFGDYHKAREIYNSAQETYKHKYEIVEFQKKIDCKFNNQELIRMALTLKNYRNTGNFHNQRLEFLGDAVLDLCVVEWEFNTLKTAKEGPLTKIKHLITSNETLKKVAIKLELEKLMRGEHLYEKAFPDCVESIIAAIYLDQGMDKAREFVIKYCLKEAIECSKTSQYLFAHQTYENRKAEITKENKDKIQAFENTIGVKFSNPYLIQEALTPPAQNNYSNFQRLEFLGDTVLKFIIVNHLFHSMKDSDEG